MHAELFRATLRVQAVVLTLALVMLSACGPAPMLVPFDGPVAKVQPVFVATSRNEEGGVPPAYGGERAREIHYAEYDVSIPPNRGPGDLALPGRTADPTTDFVTVGSERYANEAAFIAAVNKVLAPLSAEDRHITLYIHGYNTGFAFSVLRAAQVAEDYRLKGPVVVFSWPSAERPTHYVYDRDSTLYSRDQFVQTVKALAKTRATGINVLAHSMGGFLVMEGLSRLALGGDQATLNKVSAVILAEPDIDVDVFRTQVAGLDLRRLGVVVLVSDRDRVLLLSSFVAGGTPRLGEPQNLETLRRLGVIVVDLSNFSDGTFAEHNAFQRSPELLAMIGSGELEAALRTGEEGENIVVGALNAVGSVALAVAYFPYELTQ